MSDDREIFARRTAKQAVRVVESSRFGYVLVLDEEIQTATLDEGEYHRHIVDPALKIFDCRNQDGINVLILGGGDGCALRDVLRYECVSSVLLIEHDRELVEMFAVGELGTMFGTGAGFSDRRVRVLIEDARTFVISGLAEGYDLVIVDLTDDWLTLGVERLLAGIRPPPDGETLVSMSMGGQGGLSERWAEVGRAGLTPIEAWTFEMPSYGEEWTIGLARKGLRASSLPRVARQKGQP